MIGRLGSLGRLGRLGGGGSVSLIDVDAAAFITAAGLTDATQITAVKALVKALKDASIWTKFAAIYPVVGGIAASHKYNLKDPRDLDAAFRLTFSGSITHSATGMLPNGISGYADTKYNPVEQSLSLTSAHLAYYQRAVSDTGTTRVKIGSQAGVSFPNSPFVLGRTTSGSRDTGYITGDSPSPNPDISASRSGFAIVTKRGSASVYYNNNGSDVNNSVISSGTYGSFPLFLMTMNVNGFASLFANKEMCFASIGSGLTDSECLAYYNAVQAFQTALGRQV